MCSDFFAQVEALPGFSDTFEAVHLKNDSSDEKILGDLADRLAAEHGVGWLIDSKYLDASVIAKIGANSGGAQLIGEDVCRGINSRVIVCRSDSEILLCVVLPMAAVMNDIRVIILDGLLPPHKRHRNLAWMQASHVVIHAREGAPTDQLNEHHTRETSPE